MVSIHQHKSNVRALEMTFSLSADNPNINLPHKIHLVMAFVLLATES